MKRLLSGILVLILILATGCGTAKKEEKDNTKKSNINIENKGEYNFELETLMGKTLQLSDYKGKTVVLNFFTTKCTFCIKEMPYFVKVAEEYKDKDVAFLFVNVGEDKGIVDRFLKAEGFNIDVLMDVEGNVFNDYALWGVPSTIFINKNNDYYETNTGLMEEKDLINTIEDMRKK